MSSSKNHGKTLKRVFLDVFSPFEFDSEVDLSLKNLVMELAKLWSLAVQHCSSDTFPASIANLVPLLDSNLADWVSTFHTDLRKHARRIISGSIGQDTIDQYTQEHLEECLFIRRREVKEEALAAATSLCTEATLAATKQSIDDKLTAEINAYRQAACVRSQELRDNIDARQISSVVRTSKLDKPSPLAPHSPHKLH